MCLFSHYHPSYLKLQTLSDEVASRNLWVSKLFMNSSWKMHGPRQDERFLSCKLFYFRDINTVHVSPEKLYYTCIFLKSRFFFYFGLFHFLISHLLWWSCILSVPSGKTPPLKTRLYTNYFSSVGTLLEPLLRRSVVGT